jgi:hypothetical protein
MIPLAVRGSPSDKMLSLPVLYPQAMPRPANRAIIFSANRPAMPASRVVDDGRDLLQRPAGVEGLGVVHDRLERQHALALV